MDPIGYLHNRHLIANFSNLNLSFYYPFINVTLEVVLRATKLNDNSFDMYTVEDFFLSLFLFFVRMQATAIRNEEHVSYTKPELEI